MRGISALTAALALLLSACGGGDTVVASATATLDEYVIDLDASRWSADGVSLDVTNEGEFAHTLLVTGADGEVLAATDLIAPGTVMTLDLDLPPGTFGVSCRIVIGDPDGGIVDHFEEGMRATVKVVG